MSKTFVQAYTDLLDMVNRPASETEVLAAAKRELNNAIIWLQRNHAYRYTERLSRFTFPANAITVALSVVCEGLLRDIVSVQTVASDVATQGTILEYKTYGVIQSARRDYQRKHSTYSLAEEYQYVCDAIGHSGYVDRVHRFYLFRAGEAIGLYPTPAADVQVIMHSHIWMPLLENDLDTSFFLDYGYDVVLLKALQNMSLYMKEDVRIRVEQDVINAALASFIQWDSQLSESANSL